MFNLQTVLAFEVTRTLKKRTFWISALLFPFAICMIFLVIKFSGEASDKAAENAAKQSFSIEITDKSGLLTAKQINTAGATVQTDKTTGIDDVKDGKSDAYFYFPADLSASKVEIYGKDEGLFENGKYETVAKTLLKQAAAAQSDQQVVTVLSGGVTTETNTFKNGVAYDGFKQLILPGVFLILFYVLIVVFGNQMLTSTTEEKENRVIEMLLTSVTARTIIVGKIIALFLLGMIQVAIIAVPILVVYLLFRDYLSLPNVDLSQLPIDPFRIAIGAVFFVLSFLFFTGLLVGIGASMPTAKEASAFFGIVMLFLFGPLYSITLFVSAPESGIVKFLSFFPLTAPIPLLLRNAVGNLAPWEVALGTGILLLSAGLSLMAAVRLFRYGALEYSRRISLTTLFRR